MTARRYNGLQNTKTLFLEFCNVNVWSVDVISKMYEKYRIVHSKDGESRGWEDFCKTRHDKRMFFFRMADVEKLTKGLYIPVSPNQSAFADLFKSLSRSQKEYRIFLDRCRKGKFDDCLELLGGFLSNITNSIPSGNPICFVRKAGSVWTAEVSPNVRFFKDIESCVEWDFIKVALDEIESERILGHLEMCEDDKCNKFFVYVRQSRRFCSKGCRYNAWKDRQKLK